MPTTAVTFEQQQKSPAVAFKPLHKTDRLHARDQGPDLLAHMEHFVKLVRRVHQPALLQALLDLAAGDPQVPLPALAQSHGLLSIVSRDAVFAAVAQLPIADHARLERAAERIVLLSDDSGVTAMSEVLNTARSAATAGVHSPPIPDDKFTLALWLYLQQEGAQTKSAGTLRVQGRCFDHVEARQEMLRQAQAGKYFSHYFGPRGVQPKLNEPTQAALRTGLAAMFPDIDPGTIVIEAFVRHDETLPGNPVGLYTLTAMFNGKRLHYQQLEAGEVVERDEPAVIQVGFAWKPGYGALGVYCDGKANRSALATLFRDVVLGGSGDFHTTPMREFELIGFATAEMLTRLKTHRMDGIEDISIQHIVLSKSHTREIPFHGHTMTRVVQSELRIRRHRDEERSVYDVAREDYGISAFAGYEILEVKLSLRLKRQAHRRARTVTVEVRAPNGLSDRCKTDADRELVFAQLVRLGCAWQY